MIDTHTHSKFSHDGKFTARQMAERGKALGLSYLAITDHCDYDYRYNPAYRSLPMIDIPAYLAEMARLKAEFPFLATGLECGYSREAHDDYCKLPVEEFDYIINSVHTVHGTECYFEDYFEGKGKAEAYRLYLQAVLESLSVQYPFQGVGHIGYVRKNAPYPDTALEYAEFSPLLDAIFLKIIELDKALEINSNVRTKNFMPTEELVRRYFALGGRAVTFASDAHVTERLGELYGQATDMIREIGFTHWTVYRNQKAEKIELCP